MKLKSIFQKKINRDIKGVIKAGYIDEYNIKYELEEFIVTDEVKIGMDKFFNAYKGEVNELTEDNAVWISGFFGSGKSHFLKILSYILKNENICGKSVTTYFKNKGLNKRTIDNIKKVECDSNDVILFNVAAKIEQSSSHESLVMVFNRAFNEMRGLCEGKPWVAAMEEQLISEGVYKEFKNIFRKVSGKEWTKGRENFYFEKDAIIKALVQSVGMSEESAELWCNKSEEGFTLTVEDLADNINEYCSTKGDNHKVIFLIDEIGQYIRKDPRLLLNLQTIVEEMAIKCREKCWVIVTAQEELNSFVEEGVEDFSKILGRFKTKISLSSVNSDEVIKKRLLKKNQKSEAYLKSYFEKNEGTIKNLIMFSPEVDLNGYRSCDDFIEAYPFITYEFKALQLILSGISSNNLSGKDISKGERTLLECFQSVGIKYMNEEFGNIIPLYAFYESLEDYIGSSIKEIILEAKKNNAIDEYTLNVLKTLFLIKYVYVLESDINNIATMMISHIGVSKKVLIDDTSKALEKLIKAGYVENRGNEYVFLTKEEQLINKKINEILIERDKVSEKIGSIIFERIYKSNRFVYSSQYKFYFNKYVDYQLIGAKRSEIGVRIITDIFEIKGDKISELKRLSEVKKEVVIDISDNLSYVDMVERLLKIDTYIRRNHGVRCNEVIEHLNIMKIKERESLILEVEETLKEALRKSSVFVSGRQLNLGYKSEVNKIEDGLASLINTEYFKLHYVKSFKSDINELESIFNNENYDEIKGECVGELALEEVRSFLEVNLLRENEINLNDILDRFTKMPYGWKEIDIQCIILALIKNDHIKVSLNDSTIGCDKSLINRCIINKISSTEILFKPMTKINSKYLSVLSWLIKELFNITLDTKDPQKAMEEFKKLCKEELNEINYMIYELNNNKFYPGKELLDLGYEIFMDVFNEKEEKKFYKEVYDLQDDFQAYINDIDEVKGFYFKKYNGKVDILSKGCQRSIFDKAIKSIEKYQDDEIFIDDSEVVEVIEKVKEIIFNKKPYSSIQKLPNLLKIYDERISPIIDREINRIKIYGVQCKNEVVNLLDINDHNLKISTIQEYDELIIKISKETSLMKLAALEKLVERKTAKYKHKLKN